MKGISILREDLRSCDNVINSIGWCKATPLMITYRKWLIAAIQFIQLKNFDKT